MASLQPEALVTTSPAAASMTETSEEATISPQSPLSNPPSPQFTFNPSLASFNVPLNTYLATSPAPHGIKLQGICVGAFVFNSTHSPPKLLVVQRAPHDSYPLKWEVPGGSIDTTDTTLLSGVVRELYEETGLPTAHISGLVGKGYTFLTRRPACVCKYSFIVETASHEVQLDPDEHVAYLWVTEDEARAKRCGDVEIEYTTKQQGGIILEAFQVEEERGS